MRLISELVTRFGIAGELLAFMWHQKLWWMLPLILVLLFMGLLIGFGTSSGVGPFIYTLF